MIRTGIACAMAPHVAALIYGSEHLAKLVLFENRIGDQGLAALVNALRTTASLSALDLGMNRIGPKGAKALSRALRANGTLSELRLYFNYALDARSKACVQEVLAALPRGVVAVSHAGEGMARGGALYI
jgi:Ran GTPase-activating protein (RanGAP) involved in mRNA processing and transport